MAGDDAASVKTSGSKPNTLSSIDIPSEQPLLHTAIQIREELDDNLATLASSAPRAARTR